MPERRLEVMMIRLIPLLALPLFACGDKDDAAGGDTDGMDTDMPMDTDTTAMYACNVCEDYGSAVPTVSEEITARAAADVQFGPFFAPLVAEGPEAVVAFEVSLANFISDAYGCTTGAYTGPSMEEAHAGMNITQAQYDDFIGLIAGVLTDAGVPVTYVNECFAPALVEPMFANTIIGQ